MKSDKLMAEVEAVLKKKRSAMKKSKLIMDKHFHEVDGLTTENWNPKQSH